jgi:hypothetical protein
MRGPTGLYQVKILSKNLLPYRDLLETGAVWKDKLERHELWNAKIYLVLDSEKERNVGWIIYHRKVKMFSFPCINFTEYILHGFIFSFEKRLPDGCLKI